MTWYQGSSMRIHAFSHSKMQIMDRSTMFLCSIKSLIEKQVTGYLLLVQSPQDLPSSCRRKLVWLEYFSTDQRCLLQLSSLLSGASLQCIWGFIPAPRGPDSNPTSQLFPSTTFPFFIKITSSLLSWTFPASPLFLVISFKSLLWMY